jgi:hypothetical protein
MIPIIEQLFNYYHGLAESDVYKAELREGLREIQDEVEAACIEAAM